ncbi:hypothetical protein [Natronorarus salvus]|uniref:hypothetical protein n=1 Tax=Natronorarus salvus TaxID=3117733 RepID=UPI002F262799
MSFSVSWKTLLEGLDGLPEGATFLASLSHRRFRVVDTQEHRVVIRFEDSGEKRPLQREQFETLYHRVRDARDGFALDRLPPDADPYPAVLSLHPRFEVDEEAGVIVETEGPTSTRLVDAAAEPEERERTEPDGLDVYSESLLLVDALERHDVTDLQGLETETLVDLYTLLSDVQRNADDFRREVTDTLLARLHHDRPVHGQYGSVRRTSRRNRSLKDDEVLSILEDAGIDRERVTGVDREKVDEALEVTTLPESAVYDVDEREYVRKAEVDEEVKRSRLQGLKDRLATSEDAEAETLRREIEELERRIGDLTSFRTGGEIRG